MAQPTNGNSMSPSIKHASIIISPLKMSLQTLIMISMLTAYLTRTRTTGIKYSHMDMFRAGMTAHIVGKCRSGMVPSTSPSANQLIRGAISRNHLAPLISSGCMSTTISLRQDRERTCP